MRDPEPLELEPAEVPRHPTTVTLGDGRSERRWRRGGLAALGLLAAAAAITVAPRAPPAGKVIDVDTGAHRELEGAATGPPVVSVRTPGGWVMESAEPGLVWLIRDVDGRTIATEVTLDGAATGRVLEIPSTTHAVAAVEGGLLVEGFGRFYVRTVDEIRMVGTGALVAAARRWLATQSCDYGLRCGVHLVDLGTGVDRVLDVGVGWDVRSPSGSFAPDGQTLALWLHGKQGARLVFVDTDTATVAELPEPRPRVCLVSVCGDDR